MAQARKARPISPHLQIWRWGPAMLVSILHRVTGNGLAFAGLGLLLWWIGALANGQESYQSFLDYTWTGAGDGLQPVTAILGKVVLIGLTWAFFQHAASGIRHLILDIGAGYELEANSRWSVITIAFSAIATILLWAFLLLR
ncbi:succinate dehydrogenase, cytochrome b556 subunit [Novosphingobium sp.]|uniref:succinate dehydrogenase, cytochrome b556 subunit n=1 Tax=Novosphingobium sp. TaxID=1874826 RepID=UPI0035673627